MSDFKKIVALLIIISLTGGVFFLYVQQAKAGAFMYFLKEFIIKPLVRKLANALENKLVNSINGLVSGLIQKTPSFIQNWRNYILDSQARGNDIFRSVLADARLCPYFKTNLQKAFGADKYIGALSGGSVKIGGITVYQNKTSIPGLPAFQNIANCTMPANFNINTFRNDFARGGGWDAWNKLIQPQNNFFGVYSLALGEQAMQMQTEKESARDYSIAGQGFLGQKLGTTGASPNGCIKEEGESRISRCMWFGKEVTPPKFLADLSAKSLETKIGRVGYGQELTDVVFSLVSAVINALSNKILNFTGQGSYSSPPGGGANFDETGATEIPPPEYSNPATICRNACENDYNQCISKAKTEVCTPNPEPPPEEICQSEPDQVEIDKCTAARDSCTSSCSQ
jgi:hypothetical protein